MIAKNQATAAALIVPAEPRKTVMGCGAVMGWFNPPAGHNSAFT